MSCLVIVNVQISQTFILIFIATEQYSLLILLIRLYMKCFDYHIYIQTVSITDYDTKHSSWCSAGFLIVSIRTNIRDAQYPSKILLVWLQFSQRHVFRLLLLTVAITVKKKWFKNTELTRDTHIYTRLVTKISNVTLRPLLCLKYFFLNF